VAELDGVKVRGFEPSSKFQVMVWVSLMPASL
jgi:hypothetical protein